LRFLIRTLIAASHGTDNSNGALAISRLVTKVNEALNPADVREAFVDVQQPDVPTVLAQVSEATIVPLLLATGYHVRQDIADAAFEHGDATITPALGPDQRLVDVLVQRLAEAGHQAEDLVVLTVAGSSDARAQAETSKVKAMLEASLGKQVELAFLSAAEPKLKDLVPKLKFQNPRKRIVVSTYLLAPGFFSDLMQKVGAHIVTNPLLSPELETPQQLIDIVIERFTAGQKRSGQTGCLDGMRGKPFEGCAAGCASACRQPA